MDSAAFIDLVATDSVIAAMDGGQPTVIANARGQPDDAVRGGVPRVGRAPGWIQPGADSVRKVSHIPPLGGRAAEALVFGVTTTGAETGLEHATGIARQMVGRGGISDQIEEGSVQS